MDENESQLLRDGLDYNISLMEITTIIDGEFWQK